MVPRRAHAPGELVEDDEGELAGQEAEVHAAA
jgi:hypothetical protein